MAINKEKNDYCIDCPFYPDYCDECVDWSDEKRKAFFDKKIL